MNEIIIIRTGYKYRGLNWDGIIPGYFEDRREADTYLTQKGYTLDNDGKYIKTSDDDVPLLARIESLEKINVESPLYNEPNKKIHVTDQQIQHIKNRLATVDDYDWVIDQPTDEDSTFTVNIHALYPDTSQIRYIVGQNINPNDAEFIVHAQNDIRSLLYKLEKAQALLAKRQ